MTIVRQNNFEAGVAPGTVVDGVNSAAGGSAFTLIDGSPTYTATAMHGALGMDCTASGVAAMASWQSITSTLTGAVRYGIYRTSTPSTTFQIMTVRNSSNYVLGNNLTTANKLTANQWGGGTLYTSTTTLTVNTWYRVEQTITVNATGTGALSWKLFLGDSTTALETFTTSTADFQSTGMVMARLGKHAASGSLGMIVDDFAFADTASFIGPYSGALALQRVRSITSNPGVFTLLGTAPDMVTALTDSDDTTGVESPGSPSGASITMDFGDITDNQGVRFTVKHKSPTDTGNISRVYTVKQGATTIATRTQNPLPTTATVYQITLSSGEVALLSGRSSLTLTATDTLV